MSMAICDKCGAPVDSDDDPECFENDKNQCICESCREEEMTDE